MNDDRLPDYRSAWGHAMSDLVQDLLQGYDRTALVGMTTDQKAVALADVVLRDMGVSPSHYQRIGHAARAALVQWCRGVVEG